jgi:hypothetical protein
MGEKYLHEGTSPCAFVGESPLLKSRICYDFSYCETSCVGQFSSKFFLDQISSRAFLLYVDVLRSIMKLLKNKFF